MDNPDGNKTNTPGLVTGLLLGLAAGALLGIALAPRKGSETTQKVADWLEELIKGSRKGNTADDTTAESNDPEDDRPV